MKLSPFIDLRFFEKLNPGGWVLLGKHDTYQTFENNGVFSWRSLRGVNTGVVYLRLYIYNILKSPKLGQLPLQKIVRACWLAG